MITKVKKFFQWGLLLAILGLGFYSIFLRDIRDAHAVFSRSALQAYEHNLDALEDKTGSLDDLIGELQNYRVFTVTGAVVGTTVPVPGLLPTDTINEVVVYASASVVCGSTIIGNPGDGKIALQSKVWGYAGFKLAASFVKQGSPSLSSSTLFINTTGYNFQINLTTSDNNAQVSSANAIVNAINNHPWLGRMIRASTVAAADSFSTETIKTVGLIDQRFWNGVGSDFAQSASTRTGTFPASMYTIPNNFITITSSGNIVISTASPITSVDALDLKTNGYRQ